MIPEAPRQPGALQEVMLHETAVAWCRWKLAQCTPARPWLETHTEYGQRLKAVAAEINREHHVGGLCKELPSRISKLIREEGGRIAK